MPLITLHAIHNVNNEFKCCQAQTITHLLLNNFLEELCRSHVYE